MILYLFKCTECGYCEDIMLKCDDREKPNTCSKCGGVSERQMTAPLLGRIHGYNAKNGYSEKPDWHPKSNKYNPNRKRTDEERRKGI